MCDCVVYVDVGRSRCQPQCKCIYICIRQIKWLPGLTRDIKRKVVNRSFDSAAEIVGEVGLNVS